MPTKIRKNSCEICDTKISDPSNITANFLTLRRFASLWEKNVRHTAHNEFSLHLLGFFGNVLKVLLQPRTKTLIFWPEETFLICRGERVRGEGKTVGDSD
jgi:hypothetical protein